MMDWLIFLIASGAVYFVGIGAILLSIAGFVFIRRAWATVLSTLIAVIGLILIVLSATPAPYWFYGCAGAASLFWLLTERSRRQWLRRLASRHGVLLIPKRVLISVLTGNGMTVDGVHLTQTGHDRLAAVVWDIIRPAYGE